LVRYGAIPEVARFQWSLAATPERGQAVVVNSHRGQMLGTVLEEITAADDTELETEVLRLATADDLRIAVDLKSACTQECREWEERISKWNLELQLLDLEKTLDGAKKILYVLCDRGPDSTKLALQAAAEGLGIIEVQPVDAEGLVTIESGGGGCGSGGGGCGSGGGGCSH
ncbi:PSP1 C-terminal domain-containing protein, partial [Planctomycetaceae bacterium]|nr:PSP1 C-terminal domain-containing protein [Planctomycetaceae bacterium]